MTQFYLVRHGQASFGTDNYDKLSELGWQQAKWLGEYFAQRDILFDATVHGDLVRHVETAEGIHQGAGCKVNTLIDKGLNEFDFESLVKAYLTKFPEDRPAKDAPRIVFYGLLKKAMISWYKDELDTEFLPETWQQFNHRVSQALQRICERYHGQNVLIVSSGGAIAMLMSIVLGFDANNVVNLNLQIKNTSFSHFYFNSATVRLSSFNNISHLDMPQRQQAITYS